ncbi:MAG: DUF6605 domain-containing protein [Pseudomonadales bacterium]
MQVKELVAYLDPLSVTAGETLRVMVSCHRQGSFRAELVRLVSGDSRPHGTGFLELPLDADFAGAYPAREQMLQPGSYARLPDLPELAAMTFALAVFPTTPDRSAQTLFSRGSLRLEVQGRDLVLWQSDGSLRLPGVVRSHRWHQVHVALDSTGGEVTLAARRLPAGVGERGCDWQRVGGSFKEVVQKGDWLLAARESAAGPQPGFNGRLEQPRLWSQALPPERVWADGAAPGPMAVPTPPALPAPLAAWDFSREPHSDRLLDVTSGGRHGVTVQLPTRAVKGSTWDGTVQRWLDAPAQYAAIHFHEDDLADADWSPDIEWIVPDDLPSGVYAVKLTLDDSEDYAPFFVRPGVGQRRADVAYLASTATYIAYANQRLGLTEGIFGSARPKNPNDAYLLDHPEVCYSLYEYHADGSGVHFSSRLRPVLNLKPKGVPWSFTADCNLINWLDHEGCGYDVITDEDLHREGRALLDHYRVLVTGTHPEYYSTAMLDAVEGWLGGGGRLMYMGGNGFYWRIAYHPERPGIIEVRRAEDGTRAWIAEPGEYYHAFTGEYGGLWRRLGRPPNAMVGIGFAAQGFDGGTWYRLQPGAQDPRAAFIMDGVRTEEILGNYGTQGGGAAGEEIDRFDESLGSPRHALVLASSENHRPGMLRVKEEYHMMEPPHEDPKVRADLTFFETPAGGAVFSTGSISYAGSLAVNDFDNDIARLTSNVLRRFADPTPFQYPEDA